MPPQGFKGIRKAVDQYATKGTLPAINYYHDLIHTAMLLYNFIGREVKRGFTGDNWIDRITKTSKFITDDDNKIRSALAKDQVFWKGWIHEYYNGEQREYAPPTAVKNFQTFSRRDNRVKTAAVEFVIKAWDLWSRNRLAIGKGIKFITDQDEIRNEKEQKSNSNQKEPASGVDRVNIS